jgi:hypothetical protein
MAKIYPPAAPRRYQVRGSQLGERSDPNRCERRQLAKLQRTKAVR